MYSSGGTRDFTVSNAVIWNSACSSLSRIDDCGKVCQTLKRLYLFLPGAEHLMSHDLLFNYAIQTCTLLSLGLLLGRIAVLRT